MLCIRATEASVDVRDLRFVRGEPRVPLAVISTSTCEAPEVGVEPTLLVSVEKVSCVHDEDQRWLNCFLDIEVPHRAAFPANVPRDRVERSSSAFQTDACTTQAVGALRERATGTRSLSSSSTIRLSSSRPRRVSVSAMSFARGTLITCDAVNVRFGVKDSNLRNEFQKLGSYRWTNPDQVPSERVELSTFRVKAGCSAS